MKNEAKPRVYDILAKAFVQEDVRTCFALLGDANMNWAARLSEGGCRMIYVRHEHCALAAAMAYSRKNRDVGVATVTCGPGVTQLITALPAAASRTSPRSDRYSVRSAGPAVGRTCGSAQALAQIVAAPFADSAASRRRGQRRATCRRCRTGCRAGRPGCGRSPGGRRLPGVGRQDGWIAVHDASRERAVPRRSFLHRHLGQLHTRGRP